MNENLPVAVLLGAGSMGCAIIRRIGAGKTILLCDPRHRRTLKNIISQ